MCSQSFRASAGYIESTHPAGITLGLCVSSLAFNRTAFHLRIFPRMMFLPGPHGTEAGGSRKCCWQNPKWSWKGLQWFPPDVHGLHLAMSRTSLHSWGWTKIQNTRLSKGEWNAEEKRLLSRCTRRSHLRAPKLLCQKRNRIAFPSHQAMPENPWGHAKEKKVNSKD